MLWHSMPMMTSHVCTTLGNEMNMTTEYRAQWPAAIPPGSLQQALESEHRQARPLVTNLAKLEVGADRDVF